MPELTATLSAIYAREHRHNKFAAAIKGIDIDEGNSQQESSGGATTFDEIKARAVKRLKGSDEEANKVLFGIDGMDGTGYSLVGM